MITPIEKQLFKNGLKELSVPDFVEPDFLYDVYCGAIDGIKDLVENNIINSLNNVNHFELVNYIIGEYIYIFSPLSEEDRIEYRNKENIASEIASVAADKYLTLSLFNYSESKFTNKFYPTISSLNLYLNFMLNILNQYDRNEPSTTLIRDLLIKSVSLSRCILSLLVGGFQSEAFALWRTLHECECTLIILEKYKEPAINAYLKHMQYGIVFRQGEEPNPETDKIFAEIKAGMKEHDLKSKDMKKYIEYGWLYAIEDFKQFNTLNFRDGVEKLAGLEIYSKQYANSSELIHSTPILIYSNKPYFHSVTLLVLYESFFRLEKIFTSELAPRVSQEQSLRYQAMRGIYYSQLLAIHKRELSAFVKWQESKKKAN